MSFYRGDLSPSRTASSGQLGGLKAVRHNEDTITQKGIVLALRIL